MSDANLDILKWKNRFYKIKKKHSNMGLSYHNSKIKTTSRFQDVKSDNFKLPVIVSGRVLTAGEYRDPNSDSFEITPESLKNSLESWKGLNIYKGHQFWLSQVKRNFESIDGVIGRILNVSWNEKECGIDYIGAIYDRDIAYKISNDLIKYVSAGFMKELVWKGEKAYAEEIEPKELSLVFNPHDKKASIRLKEINY